MLANEQDHGNLLNDLIQTSLKPLVRAIDESGAYPEAYMRKLGGKGLLPTAADGAAAFRLGGAWLVERTSATCMTTGFNLWCHLAAMTYLRSADSDYLRSEELPRLEQGALLGGTGLSNPMKHYAGLESLHLKARRTAGGYTVSGTLPSVSNLGESHSFGIIASLEEGQPMMAFVPCAAEGLTLKEKLGFLGLNGSATYACDFRDVFIPDEWVISEQADDFVARIRSDFVLFQIPLGFGVTQEAIRCMERMRKRQDGCNRYLPDQPEELEKQLGLLRDRLGRLAAREDGPPAWSDVVSLRLDTVYLTLRAVQADMLHCGGPAYLQRSDPSRRLREAYFLANLTPTIRHLEKMKQLAGQ